jgi:hypothetical protein
MCRWLNSPLEKNQEKNWFLSWNADWRWAGFLAQKLVRRTELSVTTKLSSGDETPPIANVLLCGVLLCRPIRF